MLVLTRTDWINTLIIWQIDTFVEFLQPATVNDKIFPHIVHGFTDTNPVVRESTIKVRYLRTFGF
jgi:SCY1-like protein 1